MQKKSEKPSAEALAYLAEETISKAMTGPAQLAAIVEVARKGDLLIIELLRGQQIWVKVEAVFPRPATKGKE